MALLSKTSSGKLCNVGTSRGGLRAGSDGSINSRRPVSDMLITIYDVLFQSVYPEYSIVRPHLNFRKDDLIIKKMKRKR